MRENTLYIQPFFPKTNEDSNCNTRNYKNNNTAHNDA